MAGPAFTLSSVHRRGSGQERAPRLRNSRERQQAAATRQAAPRLLAMRMKRFLANLAKRDLGHLTALVKTRLKRMQYQPGLLDGFLASAAADFVCFGGCPPSGGCRVGRPVRCPRLRWPGCVPRQPHAPRQPRPRRLWAALPSPANSSDVPLMPLERQRCSIDAVCSGWRARGRVRGRGERGVRGMRRGTAGGANPACRGTSIRLDLVPFRNPHE